MAVLNKNIYAYCGGCMVFKRKIYQKLIEWKKEANGTRALLIEGARRIGKSTIVEEFGKKEYRSYILIDFSIATDTVKSYFLKYMDDLNTLFMLLSAAYGKNLYERESLIIFDEVQLFPVARQAIKQLVKDGRYDYVETGSLISIKENVSGILIPSEERKMKMYPMDFEEFLWAMNEEPLLGYLKDCFDNRKEVERGLHEKAMMLFKKYILVGGMPKVVSEFIESNQNFARADAEKRDILELYRDDIRKIKTGYRNKVAIIFDQIPSFLSQHEKRIVYNQVAEGTGIADLGESFFWLQDAMICNECFNTSDPNIGLSLNEERTYVKCYLNDTGLLVSHAFDENELMQSVYTQILNDKLSLNEGMLYENVIAQMLIANGHKLFFFNHYNQEKRRNDIEIDFIISNNSKLKLKIYPIEVKSSKRYTIKSLERFTEKYRERVGESIVLHPKNLRMTNGVLYLPCYMAMFLK